MDRLVQRAREADLDPEASDHRNDLADPVPDNHDQLWVRVRLSVSRQDKLVDRSPVRDQLGYQSDLYPDPIPHAQSTSGRCRHRDCLGNHPVVHGRYLAVQQMGFNSPSPLLDLGVDRNGAPVLHHLLELGKMTARSFGSMSICALGDSERFVFRPGRTLEKPSIMIGWESDFVG